MSHNNAELDVEPVIQQRKQGLSTESAVAQVIKTRVIPKLNEIADRAEDRLGELFDYVEHLQGLKESSFLSGVDLVRISRIYLGVLMLLFGRSFIVTFTMVEAFHHGGSSILMDNVSLLQKQIQSVVEANEKDNLIDDDGDGIADVDEISKKALLKRKIKLVTTSIQPAIIKNAFQAFWTATIGAATAVKIDTAKAIALGVSMGDDIDLFTHRSIVPTVVPFINKELHPWLPLTIRYTCRFLGVLIAFITFSYVSIVATSTRGSFLLVEYLQAFVESQRQGSTAAAETGEPMEYDIRYVLALSVIGILFQSYAYEEAVPMWGQLIFFPAFGVEHVLHLFVSTIKTDAEKFRDALGSGPSLIKSEETASI